MPPRRPPLPLDAVDDALARLRPSGSRPFPLETEEARRERAEVEEVIQAAFMKAARPAVGLDSRLESPSSLPGLPPSSLPLVRDWWGDPTPAERLVEPEADACPLSLRAQVARALAPEAWKAADASLRQADAVLTLIERRRTG